MAIAFDSKGTGVDANNNGTIQWTHTISSNTNGIIIANFGISGVGVNINASPTYAGTAMTKIGTARNSINNVGLELWYLLSPPTGLGTFHGTWDGNSTNKAGVSMAYTGVAQTNPIVGSTTFIGTSVTSGSITRTLAANNWFVGGLMMNSKTGTTATGNKRGTANTTFDEAMGADATGGTIRWTSASVSVGMVGAELAIFPAGIGTKLIQSTGTSNLGLGSTLVTFPSNMTQGNLIVVGVTVTNAAIAGAVSSITDGQNNTYVKAIAGTFSEATSVIDEEIWYAKNITGGTGILTVNHTVDNAAVFAREYSGGYNTLDVTSSATGSSTTPNSGTSATTISANELIIVSTGDDKGVTQTYTAAGLYGDMVGTTTTLTGLSMEDNIITSAAAQTGTLTLGAAANWQSLLASFYVTSSTAGWRSLMGVGN